MPRLTYLIIIRFIYLLSAKANVHNYYSFYFTPCHRTWLLFIIFIYSVSTYIIIFHFIYLLSATVNYDSFYLLSGNIHDSFIYLSSANVVRLLEMLKGWDVGVGCGGEMWGGGGVWVGIHNQRTAAYKEIWPGQNRGGKKENKWTRSIPYSVPYGDR